MRGITGPLIDQLPAGGGAGPTWLAELRAGSSTRLRESGFPHHKVEAWRFTSVKPLAKVPFAAPSDTAVSADVNALVAERLGDSEGAHRVVLVNGRLVQSTEVGGVTIAPLSEILADNPADLEGTLGSLARSEHFGALNDAMFQDGLLVDIAAGTVLDQPIELVHVLVPGTEPTAAHPRLVVRAGERSEATVIETYLAIDSATKSLTNAVTEVVVGQGARLDHVRVIEGVASSYHLAQLAVRQLRDSYYASRVVTLGGALSRVEIDISLADRGAECVCDGVYHGAERDHVDHQIVIDHSAPRCTSNESYRGIIDGRAHAVWNGTTIVRRGANQTSAHQENRNLLLSDDASINAKPHLEIDTDDLVASHGATIGALDEDQLFYLRARGLSEDQARAALTYAFVQSVLDGISHQPTRDRLGRAVRARLAYGESVEELLA